MKTELALFEKVAWSFLGKPYIWGGDDPLRGFDCSGFAVEVLKSIGIIGRNTDYTAQGLFNLLNEQKKFVGMPFLGTLVFWGESIHKITHVELGIADNFTIGASGGGSKTLTVADAISQNAYIKVRPLRSGYVAIINLF